MERHFKLDKFNTYADWGLILTTKDVTPPEPKTNYVEIDGMSGTLDLSEALTGEITYKDRVISASFWTCNGSYNDREILLRKIIAALHGRKIKIVEPDDPYHYFYGRIKVKSSKNILPYMEFSIEATCEPWRYSLCNNVRKIIIDNDTATDVVINNNGVKTLIPTITVTESATLSYNGVEVSLTKGSYKIPDIRLYQGVNVIRVSGDGSVTFSYQEADL